MHSKIQSWLNVELPEGHCVGVQVSNEDECFPPSSHLDEEEEGGNTGNSMDQHNAILLPDFHWMKGIYHEDEIMYAMTNLKKASRTSFWLGRLALRTALGFPNYPILKDEYGRPKLYRGSNIKEMLASISHKQDRGVALVAASTTMDEDDHNNLILAGIGVDLELTSRPGRPSIAKRILTPSERNALGKNKLPNVNSKDEEVLLRFSLKEAIYKAAHPLLNQYVGFQEAEVTPHANGTATCQWMLQGDNATLPDKRIAKLTVHWQRITEGDDKNDSEGYDFFLTTASAYTAGQAT